MSSLRAKTIPIFEIGGSKRVAAIADMYRLRGEPGLGVALLTIYLSHRGLWVRQNQTPGSSGAKATQRSAAKINRATSKYMRVLAAGSNLPLARLLCGSEIPSGDAGAHVADINTLTRLLQQLARNSHIAMRAKAARGRRVDELAITVATELGQLYDNYSPTVPRRLKGENRGNIRLDFIGEALKLFGLHLSKESIRTYRESKHTRRLWS
jgi:hypothetical protein